jgi:hypothetical protein
MNNSLFDQVILEEELWQEISTINARDLIVNLIKKLNLFLIILFYAVKDVAIIFALLQAKVFIRSASKVKKDCLLKFLEIKKIKFALN